MRSLINSDVPDLHAMAMIAEYKKARKESLQAIQIEKESGIGNDLTVVNREPGYWIGFDVPVVTSWEYEQHPIVKAMRRAVMIERCIRKHLESIPGLSRRDWDFI